MAIYSNVSGVGAGLIKGVDGISINKIRSINAALSSAFALLLDESYGSGAEAAYSVRRISGVYNGPLMVIRRDSDDATLEVGFNSSNDIDSSAIEVHCAGTTCYVTEWRDQSSNGNDATQSTAATQPTIYTGGAIVKENGRVALEFDGGSDFDISITQAASDYTATFVNKNSSTASMLFDTTTGRMVIEGRQGNFGAYYDGSWKGTVTTSTNQILRTIIMASPSSGAAFTNGSQIDTGLSYTQKALGGTTKLGDSIAGSRRINGPLQEFILWPSDKSTYRTDIEENIGDYYTQNTPLLDTYTGAAAAYSLRKLSSSYSGPLIRVREDGGDTQADIYANVFGELDTVSLAAHCGSNNGFVVSWLDQSGSSNTATQPADTQQPKIYDGTTGVITENGKLAVEFNSDKLGEFSLALSQPYSFNFVGRYAGNTASAFAPFFGSRNTTFVSFMVRGNNWMQQSPSLASNSTTVDTNQHNWFLLYDGASSFVGVDGGTAATSNPGTSAIENFAIGARGTDGGSAELRYFQELVLWGSDQSSNRTGIESNINNFYDIFPGTELIDEYSGAAAAYSLRSLSEQYDGAVVTVRRDSDDAQKNIYTLSDGQIDTNALEGFCGKSNGFVVRWFDQSSNSNHATQAADANQPKIYDGSSQRVITENGKPAVEFNGSKAINIGNYSSLTEGELFISVRHITPPDNSYNGGWKISSQGQNMHWPYYTGTIYDNFGSTTRYSFTPSISLTQLNLYNSVSTSSEWTARLNSRVETTSATNTVGFSSGVIGSTGPSLKMSHNISEYILYDSAQSSTNRTGIEDNIFSHYSPAPLLDTYSGAAAAYSLRKLSSSATNAVQVRRDSDDATQYIGFVQDAFNGESLDTAALSAFCGSANGFVTEWVDQSSNSNNATQSASNNQPKIYDGTTGVVTRGGKPSVLFTGSTQILTISNSFNNNTYLYVGQPLNRSQGFGANGKSVRTNGTVGYRNFVFEWASGNLYVLHNGTVYDATSGGNISVTLGFDVVLFRRGAVGTRQPESIGRENTQYISEIISYPTLESDTNLVGISNNANTYYDIY